MVTPASLRSFLPHHTVKKTQDLGWDPLNNGELLRAAEEAAFEVFLTTDKNIRYQQNLAERVIAIVVFRKFAVAARATPRGSCRCGRHCREARHL